MAHATPGFESSMTYTSGFTALFTGKFKSLLIELAKSTACGGYMVDELYLSCHEVRSRQAVKVSG